MVVLTFLGFRSDCLESDSVFSTEICLVREGGLRFFSADDSLRVRSSEAVLKVVTFLLA